MIGIGGNLEADAWKFHRRNILQPILELVFYVAGYHVGRIVVSIVSSGRWKCDRLLRDAPKKKLRWNGLYQRRGKQIYLTAEMTALIGLVFSGLVVALIFWWNW